MTTNNVYIYNNSLNKRVTIATVDNEYIMTNNLIGEPLVIPTTGTTNTNTTKIKNMLRIVERIEVKGFIITGLNPNVSSPVERTNAQDILDDLVSIAKYRAIPSNTNTWTVANMRGVNYNVTIEKISAREIPIDVTTDAPSGVARFDITISLIVGDPLF